MKSIDKKKNAVTQMMEYILKNRNNPDFSRVSNNPERIFFKTNLEKMFSSTFLDQNFEINLCFKNHPIETKLKEFILAQNWDDLADFKQQILDKEIKIDEIINLNLKSIGEIMKSAGVKANWIECCICFEVRNDENYIFGVCGHYICKNCLFTYVKGKGVNVKPTLEGISLEFNSNKSMSVPCPKCKAENVVKDGYNYNILKFFRTFS